NHRTTRCALPRVAVEDRRLAVGLALLAPGHDVGGHVGRRRPSVDRQPERRLGDEDVARHHLKRQASGVVVALVVAGGDPGFAIDFDAHLVEASTWPAGWNDTSALPLRTRSPSACAR